MFRAKTRNALLLSLAALTAAWWLWPSSCETAPKSTGGDFSTLANRVWIDHMPTSERDKIDIFIMLDDPTLGMFSTSSSYEGDWAGFEWSLEKGLVLNMLQKNKSYRVRPKVSTGNCAPFDFCMKIGGAPRGSKTYVSMDDWVINGADELDAKALVSELLAADE